ncbi:Methylmalonyl-CoA mutase [invertebrate metagenome]|uniref:Methylmalonyl-CoA mutase n=1 Tax=invertebrate metagenome TaxID=1711999 RepID=A0A484H9U6_9ZZZZ
MNNENMVSVGDFPTPSYEEWRSAVDKALKGAPFEKKMVSQTYEGISIPPIYTSKNWPAAGEPSGFPGKQPFTRGFSACGVGAEGWCIRQEQAAPDLKVANAAILADLKHGTTSFLIRIDKAARSGLDPDQANPGLIGVDGVMAYARADFDALMDRVQLDLVPIALAAGSQFLGTAAMLASLWQQRKVTGNEAKGAFNADPLGTLAATGTLPVPVEMALAHMADLAAYTALHWPNVTAVGVDTTPYYDAGATESQDLACAMATGVAYLRAMTAAGMEVNTACHQIAFTFPVGCDFFLSMAKLRAARKLWARITESCTGTPTAARIHARTTERMLTRCDPWVNMLRTTTAAFAAGVAGANSITVLPFDHALGHADAFSRRIARNSQIILREESSLTRVIDPAGGSWYVESLTDQLAHAAWGLFQDIEKAGGMAMALRSGIIAEKIDAVHVVRERNIAHRKDPLTGISEFPNIAELVPSHPDVDRKSLADQARVALPANRVEAARALRGAELGSLTERAVAAATDGATIGSIAAALAAGTSSGVSLQSLPRHCLAESFEALRSAAAAYKTNTGAWPTIFLANIGLIAAHTGRATYAKNFFEAGGVKTLTNNGFTEAKACAAAFQDSGAHIAILCSSDALYEKYVSTMAPALKAAGCQFLFLAGNPGDRKEGYLKAGVDDFIFVGCDVLGSLRTTLSRLGVTH